MENIIFFIMATAVWQSADYFFAPPIFNFLRTNRIGPESDTARMGISECIIAIALGAIGGYFFGPFIGVSFSKTAWSWIATGCLILSSFLVSSYFY